jgi:hypothetical protein
MKYYQLALHRTAKRYNKVMVDKRAKPYELALHKTAKGKKQTTLSIVHKRAKSYQLALHKTAT